MLWIRNDLFRIQLRDFNTVVPDPSKRFVSWILIPDPTPIILNILNCYRYGITLKEHSSLFSVQLKKNIFYLLYICFYNFLGIRIRKQSVRIQKKGPNPTGFGFTTVIVVLRFVLLLFFYNNNFVFQAAIDSVNKHKIGLKSPLMTPVGKGFRSLNLALRKERIPCQKSSAPERVKLNLVPLTNHKNKPGEQLQIYAMLFLQLIMESLAWTENFTVRN